MLFFSLKSAFLIALREEKSVGGFKELLVHFVVSYLKGTIENPFFVLVILRVVLVLELLSIL